MAADVQLEAVSQLGVVGQLLGQRRNLERVLGHENGLHELALAGFLEDLADELALAPRLFHFHADALGDGAQVVEAARERHVFAGALGRKLDHGLARPRTFQVDLGALIGNAQRAARGHGGGLDDALGKLHHALEVAEGAIGLHGGELGVVRLVHALVAEDAAELVHALETAHEQALQRQLGGNAQIVIAVERVQVRDERLGVGAAHDRLQERRFHLVVAQLVFHVMADSRHDFRALLEHGAHLGVRDKIDVALTIADFLIGQAVELLGKRAQRLRQQLVALDGHGQLAAAGLHDGAPHADPIADVEVLQLGVSIFAEHVDAAEQLNLARGVAHREEADLALHALGHDAAAHLHGVLGRLAVFQLRVRRLDVGGAMRVIECVPIRVAARLDDGRALGTPHLDRIVFDNIGSLFHFGHCAPPPSEH